MLGATLEDMPEVTSTAQTGADGTAKIMGLKAGDYIITETVAPIGYNLASNPSSIYVAKNVSGVLGASVTIENSLSVPKTGETESTSSLTVAAICFLALGASALIVLNRRRYH